MTKEEIKSELKRYYAYQHEIDDAARKISQLQADRDRILIAGSSPDGQPRGSDTSDPTYAQARQRIDYYGDKIDRELSRQKEYIDKCQRIERWLDMLPVARRKIVAEKYCKQREWEAVAREVKYSVSYCKMLAKEALAFIERYS